MIDTENEIVITVNGLGNESHCPNDDATRTLAYAASPPGAAAEDLSDPTAAQDFDLDTVQALLPWTSTRISELKDANAKLKDTNAKLKAEHKLLVSILVGTSGLTQDAVQNAITAAVDAAKPASEKSKHCRKWCWDCFDCTSFCKDALMVTVCIFFVLMGLQALFKKLDIDTHQR